MLMSIFLDKWIKAIILQNAMGLLRRKSTHSVPISLKVILLFCSRHNFGHEKSNKNQNYTKNLVACFIWLN